MVGYLYLRLDDEIRRLAEAGLQNQYPHLKATIGGARYVPGRGVTLFDVAFAERRNDQGNLLLVDELQLFGDLDPKDFVAGKFAIHRVVARHPRLFATRRPTGEWNLRLLAPPQSSDRPLPELSVVDAAVVITDEMRKDAKPLMLRNLRLKVTPEALTPEALSADVSGSKDRWLKIDGQIEDSLAKQVKFSGTVNPGTLAYQLTADFSDFKLTEERVRSTPWIASRWPDDLHVTASTDGNFSLNSSGRGQPLVWSVDVNVAGGRVQHPQLPRPLSNVTFSAHADARGINIPSITAVCGEAKLDAACNVSGFMPDDPAGPRGAMNARVTNLVLDESVYRVLPAKGRKLWDRFRPAGVVDASISLKHDGQQLMPDINIACRNASFEDSEKFPYRLRQGSGSIRFSQFAGSSNGTLAIDLNAMGEGHPVHITAEFPGLPCDLQTAKRLPSDAFSPCPLGWVQIDGTSLRCTEALLSALPERTQKPIRSLNPRGIFSASWRMERVSCDQPPISTVRLEVEDGTIRYKDFPYPLRQLRGIVEGRNNTVWTFRDFVSQDPHGPRVVTAAGRFDLTQPRPLLVMQVRGAETSLDDDLLAALPPDAQSAWNQLRPYGRVNFTADVTYAVGDPKPAITLEATPTGKSVSVEPVFFPYRIEQLQGTFRLANETVTFNGVRAMHGRTRMAASGGWTPTKEGGWRFDLTQLHVDRLDANHDLRVAAPLQLRRVFDQFQPRGDFGIHNGQVAFISRPIVNGQPDIRAEWDVELDCHQTDVQVGVPIEDVSGSVRLTGYSQNDSCETRGQLQLDSLFWNGIQLTNVRGPLWADRAECRVGRGVAGKVGGASQEVLANAYGGQVAFTARAQYESNRPTYGMDIAFGGIDLPRFTTDYLQSEETISGSMEGKLHLQGVGSNMYGLTGNGEILASDVNLGQLPQMISVLKVLRNRTPDSTAFNRCESQFTIRDKHLQFSKLNFLGDAVNLYGRGEIGLDRDVNLLFHSTVGRNDFAVPLLKSFVSHASEQILQVQVGGTIDQLDIRREAFPVVSNVFQQLQSDMTPRPLNNPAATPGARALRR